ncbi:MAG: hypothetical protein AAF628_16970 [Planctomycetota bacterium]
MRRFASVSFLLTAALAAQAPTDPAVLRARLADKHAAAFLRTANWHTDLAAAQRAAAGSGKLIFAHFTRSFVPCGMSIGCERDILAAKEFAGLADRVVLYCHVTGRVDPERDQLLVECGGTGWPHHAIMDASGRVLGRHASWRDKSVAEFTAMVDRAESYLTVARDARQTIAGACRRQLEAGLETGALSLAEARRLLAEVGAVSAEDSARYTAALADLEVLEIVARHDRFDPASHAVVGREFWTMYRQGKRPAARNPTRDFWGGLLLYLESRERPDLAAYAEGLAVLEATLGDSRSYRRFLEERREALASLRAKAAAKDEPSASAPA